MTESPGENRRRKVLFVLPELGGGGAERTFLNVLNHLDREAFEPILVLYRRMGCYIPSLREDVTILSLDLRGACRAVLPLSRLIRRLRPDAIIATLQYVCLSAFLAAKLSGTGVRVVLRETNNQTAAGRLQGGLHDRAVGWAYRNADSVVALSEGVWADLIDRYGVEPGRVRRIYNPLDLPQIEKLAQAPLTPIPGWTDRADRLRIVAAGRLHRQKGFDLLISSMSRLPKPANLLILGEGEERRTLQRLARESRVEATVHLPGFVENPYAYIAAADLFVLSSRWEGFGHVVAEAMACGTAVLATRCPSGPDEIITDGVDGLLCAPDSVESLAEAISVLQAREDLRQDLAAAAKRSVSRFDVSTIVPHFEAILSRQAV